MKKYLNIIILSSFSNISLFIYYKLYNSSLNLFSLIEYTITGRLLEWLFSNITPFFLSLIGFFSFITALLSLNKYHDNKNLFSIIGIILSIIPTIFLHLCS